MFDEVEKGFFSEQSLHLIMQSFHVLWKFLYGMFHKSNILVKEDLIWHCLSSLLQNTHVPPWVEAIAHRFVKWMFIKPEFSSTCGLFFCSCLFFWSWLDQIDLTLHVICRFLGIFKGLYSSHGWIFDWGIQVRNAAAVVCICNPEKQGMLPEGNLQVPLFLFSLHR